MKQHILSILLLFCTTVFSGCSSENTKTDQKNPMETGRSFVSLLLKGDFKSVKPLLIPGKNNEDALNGFTSFYTSVAPENKSEKSVSSWKMEKWEEKDENNILMVVNHEMFTHPISLSLKKIEGKWLVNLDANPQ